MANAFAAFKGWDYKAAVSREDAVAQQAQLNEAYSFDKQVERGAYSVSFSAFKPMRPEPVVSQQDGVDMQPKGVDQLVQDEGEKLSVYKDTRGIPTIGVGFNLAEPANKDVFKQVVGFSVEDAMAGKPITKDQSRQLLDVTVKRAEADARSLLPNFDRLPAPVQDAAVNFVFNVGKSTASQFKNTLAFLNKGDGPAAANNLRQSLYYKQVGKRGERVASAFEAMGVIPMQQPQPNVSMWDRMKR